jgi:hypothetical protein
MEAMNPLSRALLAVLEQLPLEAVTQALTRVPHEAALPVRDALARGRKAELVAALSDLVASDAHDVASRSRAAWLLKDLCDRRSWPALRAVTLRPDVPDALAAAALDAVERLVFAGQISAEDVAALKSGVAARASDEVRVRWAQLLGTLLLSQPERWALETLLAVAREPSPVGDAALRVLAETSDPAAERALREYQADPSAPFAALAGQLLQERASREATDEAWAALKQGRPLGLDQVRTLGAHRKFAVLSRALDRGLASGEAIKFVAALSPPPDLTPGQKKFFRRATEAARRRQRET